MDFSWDSQKAKANLKKHKVSFEEAKTVFYDSSDEIIHTISARKATNKEKKDFEEL